MSRLRGLSTRQLFAILEAGALLYTAAFVVAAAF